MSRANFQVLVLPYVIENNKVKYCIFKRSDYNIYQFISGGGEDYETPIQAAKREAFEEGKIGNNNKFYKLDTLCSVPSDCFNNHIKLWGEECFVVREYCFAVNLNNVDIITISDEHTEYLWLDYEQAYDKLRYDSNKVALNELHNRIKRNLLGKEI